MTGWKGLREAAIYGLGRGVVIATGVCACLYVAVRMQDILAHTMMH
jgi:hypothetical protein